MTKIVKALLWNCFSVFGKVLLTLFHAPLRALCIAAKSLAGQGAGPVRLVAFALVLGLAACSRPLSEAETAWGEAVLGESFSARAVRITNDLGFFPLPKQGEIKAYKLETSKVRCIQTAPKTSGERKKSLTAAFVRFQTIHYINGYYRADLLASGGHEGLPLGHLLTFVHELVHVWQWQNRERTGYHPTRALMESVFNVDPYFYEVTAARSFFDYGYEQQARMVEDYLCLRIAEPDHPKVAVLSAILGPVFPLEQVEALIRPGVSSD